MRRILGSSIVAALVAGSACGLTGPGQDGLSVELAADFVPAGGELAFTFRNAAPRPAITGLLACAVTFEIKEGGEWRSLEANRICPSVAQTHPGMSAERLATVAPATAGTFRMTITAWFEPGPERPITVVRSEPFLVRPAPAEAGGE